MKQENIFKIWKNGFDFGKFKAMAERHKKLFKGANIENQLLKFTEEMDEHLASPCDEDEMADCYIAAAGIYNFNPYAAVMILNYLGSYGGALPHKIEKAASEKMHKNETERVWMVVNGVIRHVKLPAYADELGFIDLPDGKYIARKYACYGEPTEEVVGVFDQYLPSHYQCVLRKA